MNASRIIILGLGAGLLSGCLQNLSGTVENKSTKTTSSQTISTGSTSPSPVPTSTSTPISSAPAITAFTASTDLGGLVGSFRGAQADAGLNQLGLMINLKTPIVNSIGETTLTDLLNQAYVSPSIRNIDVTLKIPQFHVQVKFKFGKIIDVSTGELKNVMIIRPGLTRVDVASGYAPDRAPIVQQSNGYVYTYGGLVENSPIARLTMFFRNSDILSTSGFLPSVSNTSWGVNYPDSADPQSDAVFAPLTPELAKIIQYTYTTSLGEWIDPSFETSLESAGNLITNPQKYMVAIHRVGTTIQKAWVINPKAAAPEGILLCSAAYNSLRYTTTVPSTSPFYPAITYEYGDKRACNCGQMVKAGTTTASRHNSIAEYCGLSATTFTNTSTVRTVPNKLSHLQNAVTLRTVTNSTPLSQISSLTSAALVTLGDFAVSPLP